MRGPSWAAQSITRQNANDATFTIDPLKRDTMAKLGNKLYPLMCVSVHEHAWVGSGYGVWGKEEYMKRYWNVVNWAHVTELYSKCSVDPTLLSGRM